MKVNLSNQPLKKRANLKQLLNKIWIFRFKNLAKDKKLNDFNSLNS